MLIMPRKEFFWMPTIIECPSVQEVYADYGIVRDCEDVVRIVLASQPKPDSVFAEQILCVIMKRKGFAATLVHAGAEFIPKLGHADMLSEIHGVIN